ncbi:MAG: glycosyltransferase family 1 protein, partial [Sphingobacteriales bacterium]
MQIVKKIRVLECIRQGQVGGGESHLLSLVENLDRTRFEVVVLSFTDGPMVRELKKQGVETHVIYTERPFDFTKWRQVKRLIRSCSIDIIHAHGTRAASNILWAARSLNIPLIYTIHGWSFHDDQNALIRNIRVLGERYIVHRSNLNISVSESNKRTGIRYLKNLHSIVINNGIDQRKFSAQSVHQDVRKELGISNEALVVLFVARFTHQKQPHLLIESFSKALAQVPNLHLLM